MYLVELVEKLINTCLPDILPGALGNRIIQYHKNFTVSSNFPFQIYPIGFKNAKNETIKC